MHALNGSESRWQAGLSPTPPRVSREESRRMADAKQHIRKVSGRDVIIGGRK